MAIKQLKQQFSDTLLEKKPSNDRKSDPSLSSTSPSVVGLPQSQNEGLENEAVAQFLEFQHEVFMMR